MSSLLPQRRGPPMPAGRVQTILFLKLSGVTLLAILGLHPRLWRHPWLVIPIYCVRTSLINASYPLQKSILMDFVPKVGLLVCIKLSSFPASAACWPADGMLIAVAAGQAGDVEQLRVLVCAGSVQLLTCEPVQVTLLPLFLTLGLAAAGWSGSAVFGGIMLERGFAFTFSITALLQVRLKLTGSSSKYSAAKRCPSGCRGLAPVCFFCCSLSSQGRRCNLTTCKLLLPWTLAQLCCKRTLRSWERALQGPCSLQIGRKSHC